MTPTPKISALLRKRPVLLRATFVLILRTETGHTTDILVVKYTRRGLVVKRLGVLSKVQMLNLVLEVGVFSLLPKFGILIYNPVTSRPLIILQKDAVLFP